MGRPPKKGLKAEDKRVTNRRSFGKVEKGIVIGEYLAALRYKKKFNASEAARFVGAHRSAVIKTIKDYNAGELMPSTQPAAAKSSVPSEKKAEIVKRRGLVRVNALKRTKADDGTQRPVYATQKAILDSLPIKLRPTSETTIGRDIRANDIHWLSTVRTPCLGPEWKKKRVAYCRTTPKMFPAAKFASILVAMDESLLNINNSHSCKKEYRLSSMRPMEVKEIKFPPSVMVSAAVSKSYREIVIHFPGQLEDNDDEDDDVVVYKSKKVMVETEKIQLKHGISPTKRYTLAELLALSKPAQLEWMDLERRFNANKKAKGVNRFAHCHRCLDKIKLGLKGADHVILEDNAKIHTSIYTALYRKHLGLKYIPCHPANSADLNPCEHCFARLKERVAFRGPPTKDALIKMIKDEFHKIPQKDINAWIDSYWTRMEACGKRNGNWVGTRECRRPAKRVRE